MHVCDKQFTQLQCSYGARVDSIPMLVKFAFLTPARANQELVFKSAQEVKEISFNNDFRRVLP